MLRNLQRFFSWRTVLITIFVRSSERAVIWPVIPVMPVMALMAVVLVMALMAVVLVMALMAVVLVMALMAEMLVMAQMYSWVGRSAKVRLRVAVTPVAGATSIRAMGPGHGNKPCNKQETY